MIRRTRAPKSRDMRVTFALPLDEPAGPVSVVGTFNDWTPGAHPLVKRANGTRSATVTVPAGTTLRFRYLGEHGRWFDDPDADRIDEHGGAVTV